jgi:hypothetical protein
VKEKGRTTLKELELTSGQASFVLAIAIRERKLNQRDIARYLKELTGEITRMEERLTSLRNVVGAGKVQGRPKRSSAARQKRAGKALAARPRRAKVKKAVSPEVQASRALQGRYISAIRQLPKRNRAKFAALAKDKGREAAIEAMKKR